MTRLSEVSNRIRNLSPDTFGIVWGCYVCHSPLGLLHQHHIPSVVETEKVVVERNLYDLSLPIMVVQLCPNHHAVYHIIYSQTKTPQIRKKYVHIENSLTQDELNKLQEIRDKEWELYYQLIGASEGDQYAISAI